MTKSSPKRCCCGGLYAEHGGASNLYCPTGQRALCEECISKGGRICPTHKVLLRSADGHYVNRSSYHGGIVGGPGRWGTHGSAEVLKVRPDGVPR